MVFLAEVHLPDPGQADAELRRLRELHPDLVIQLVSMRKKPNAKAVEMIAAQTIRARETGALIAEKPEVDLLLRLAGTAQISEAIEKAGYKARGRRFLVGAGPDEGVARLGSHLGREEFAGRYRRIPGGRLDDEGREMVERAALLGTRN